MKKITVVTPVLCPSLKTLEVISECMKSVKNAINKVNGEFIIVDDNSKVGQSFFENIADTYIRNIDTYGVSVSLNNGMKIATGEFVVKLDSDYLVPENLFEILLKDWTDDLCFISPSYLVTRREEPNMLDLKNLPKIEGGVYDRPPGEAFLHLTPRSKYTWGGGILMFDKKKIEEIGYFDESFGIGGAQDNDVIYRLLMKGYNWRWDNNVVTRHFASISSTDKESTQNWNDIRKKGVDCFVKKHGFVPGSFINKVSKHFNYKFEY